MWSINLSAYAKGRVQAVFLPQMVIEAPMCPALSTKYLEVGEVVGSDYSLAPPPDPCSPVGEGQG